MLWATQPWSVKTLLTRVHGSCSLDGLSCGPVRRRARLKTERETGECSRLTRAQRPTQAWGSRAWDKKPDCFQWPANDRLISDGLQSAFHFLHFAKTLGDLLSSQKIVSREDTLKTSTLDCLCLYGSFFVHNLLYYRTLCKCREADR